MVKSIESSKAKNTFRNKLNCDLIEETMEDVVFGE